MRTLLDRTDRAQRALQHGPVLAGIVLLVATVPLVNTPGRFGAGVAALGAGLLAILAACFAKQRWRVVYKGHEIRFENNPFVGEKLFIDGEIAAKGQLGFRSEMQAAVQSGEGAGDRIYVIADSGLFSFRCRISVEEARPLAAIASNAAAISAPSRPDVTDITV